MLKPTRVILCILLISSFMAAHPQPAWACSCTAPPSPHDGLDQSIAVFSGSVAEIDQPWTLGLNRREPVRVTFEVDRVWKGPERAQLEAFTTESGASCGYVFEVGKDYLVYADGTETDLKVYLCSRTAPLSDAQADLAALGSGTAPAPGRVDQPWVPALALGALALGLVLFVLRSSEAEGIG